MSALLSTIKSDFLSARKDRNKELSAFLSSLVGDIESKAVTASGRVELLDEHVVATLKSYEKKGLENLSIENLSPILKNQVHNELEVIYKYLPVQLSAEKLREIFSELDTSNLGLMMKHLKENYSGSYDGALASKIAKEFI